MTVIYRKYYDEDKWELIPINKAVNALEGTVYKKDTVKDMVSSALETNDTFSIRTPNAYYIVFKNSVTHEFITNTLAQYE